MSTFFKTKNHYHFIGVTTFFFAVALFFTVGTKQAEAIIPFGGKITKVSYCPCSGNYLITVGLPVGGQFIYQPGVTIVYAYVQITRRGVWVLGNWMPGGVCLSGKSCSPKGFPLGTIEQVGTSL